MEEAQESQLQDMYCTNLNVFSVSYQEQIKFAKEKK